MHGLMGIYNTWCNRVPMVVMGATGPVDAPQRRPWIDWIHTCKDQGALLRNFVKFDDEPRSAQSLVETMLRVNQAIRTAPRGPAYVCLDAGLQETPLNGELEIPDMERFKVADPPQPPAAAVEEAADMLVAAKGVVIMAGRVRRSQAGWDDRVRLAELLGAGVATDMKTAAAFPTDHPLHLAPPMNRLRDEAVAAVKEADVILDLNWVDLAGTFKLAVGRKGPKARIINVSMESYIHNGWTMDHMGLPPSDLKVLCEAEEFVAALLPAVEKRLGGKSRWDGKNKGRETEKPQTLKGMDSGAQISPEALTIGIAEARGKRKITLGNVPIGWSADAYQFSHPLDYLGNDAGGGLSSGPGTAIGAALGLIDTDRLVVSVLGDGDTMQGSSAMWTAAHYDIPVMLIISNNRSNFNDEIHQETVAKMRDRPVENRWIGMRIDDPALDIAGYAKALGVASAGPVETVGELVAAIDKGMKMVESGKPYVLDVHVAPGYAAPPPARSAG
jgi:thiamine pyrophosphate-dependent acetolactate synthase large subunit-like protein